jgi:Holliday junction resolvasome RuvABC ATP-dependent DNA helicase subunit
LTIGLELDVGKGELEELEEDEEKLEKIEVSDKELEKLEVGKEELEKLEVDEEELEIASVPIGKIIIKQEKTKNKGIENIVHMLTMISGK